MVELQRDICCDLTEVEQVTRLFRPLTNNLIFRRYKIMAKSTLAKNCNECKIEKSTENSPQPSQKLCKCGCGQPIIIQNHHRWRGVPDFIHGHSSRIYNGMRGKKHSKETLEKFSAMRKGVKFSEEHKRKLSESQKGKHHTPQNSFKKGNTINVGRRHSEEVKARMSKSAMGKIVSEETRKKISEWHKGKPLSQEHRKKLSIMGKGRIFTKEHREKMSRAKKMSWKNPEFCKMMGRAWGAKLNKPETAMLNLLNNLYPGEWKYTGDFSFAINGKCPDFVNCNGQKLIVEVWGDYWHKGENPKDREAIFEPFGYKTLIIWEHELKHMESTIKKIRTFVG